MQICLLETWTHILYHRDYFHDSRGCSWKTHGSRSRTLRLETVDVHSAGVDRRGNSQQTIREEEAVWIDHLEPETQNKIASSSIMRHLWRHDHIAESREDCLQVQSSHLTVPWRPSVVGSKLTDYYGVILVVCHTHRKRWDSAGQLWCCDQLKVNCQPNFTQPTHKHSTIQVHYIITYKLVLKDENYLL